MKKAYIFFIILLLPAVYLLLPTLVSAANCSGNSASKVTVRVDPKETSIDGNFTATFTFEWLTADTECTNKSLSAYIKYYCGGVWSNSDYLGTTLGLGGSIKIPAGTVKTWQVTKSLKTSGSSNCSDLREGDSATIEMGIDEIGYVTNSNINYTSTPLKVIGGPTYACVAANNKYSCSADGSLAGCQNAPGCKAADSPKSPCAIIPTSSWCGKDASGPLPGLGGAYDWRVGQKIAGQDMPLGVTLKNYGPQSLTDLLNDIANWIVAISVPISTILIIYAGLLFITARGDSGQIGRAKNILTIVITAMAIIIIGRGFVSLVQGILGAG